MLKPYVWVFRGISKTTLPGDVGFLQFLRNVYQLTAFEQAEMILYAALDPAVAGKGIVKLLRMIMSSGNSGHFSGAISTGPTLRPPAVSP